MRRVVATIAITVALATAVLLPAPAQANLLAYRWAGSVVCVEDHTSSTAWPTVSATNRWAPAADIHIFARRDCGSWQTITVRSSYQGANGYYARTRIFYQPDKPWLFHHVVISINESYRSRLNWGDRRSVIMHEIGHALGLAHNSRSDSIMNVYRAFRFDYPTGYDFAEIERRYPW
jgi:predicted Zn-dependent protease